MPQKKKYPLIYKTIFILIILILPLNIISIAIMRMTISDTQKSLCAAITSNLDSYMSRLDQRLTNSNYLLYTVLEDENCTRYLEQPKGWKYTFYQYQVSSTLSSSLTVMDAADSLYFFLPKQDDLLFIDKEKKDFLTAEVFREILETQEFEDGKWHLYSYDDSFYLLRNIQQEEYSYGAIINCQNELPSFDFKEYQLFLQDTLPEKQPETLLCFSASQKTSCFLTFTMPPKGVSSYVETWKYFLFFVVMICLMIVPVLFYAFRRHVSNPLKELNHGHYELLKGNEAYRITAFALSAEFDTAYQAFNSMAQTLQTLRLEKINRELAYKQMQLNNLQLQIRPHFLLNIMNLLYTLVQNGEALPAQELILYLSQYFRYMFRNDKELELFDKELSLIKTYLKISSYHYPDAFTVSYQVDPEVYLLRVPPLLFHNFVENIIRHALVPGQVVHIVIFGEYDNGMVTIQISDDGCGMSRKDVDKINTCSFSNEHSGRHVGIRNSITRLNYYYHDGANVTVDSETGRGTTFTITIPYNLEEDDNEFTDS